jgi:hypothetical protein
MRRNKCQRRKEKGNTPNAKDQSNRNADARRQKPKVEITQIKSNSNAQNS